MQTVLLHLPLNEKRWETWPSKRAKYIFLCVTIRLSSQQKGPLHKYPLVIVMTSADVRADTSVKEDTFVLLPSYACHSDTRILKIEAVGILTKYVTLCTMEHKCFAVSYFAKTKSCCLLYGKSDLIEFNVTCYIDSQCQTFVISKELANATTKEVGTMTTKGSVTKSSLGKTAQPMLSSPETSATPKPTTQKATPAKTISPETTKQLTTAWKKPLRQPGHHKYLLIQFKFLRRNFCKIFKYELWAFVIYIKVDILMIVQP